MYIDVNPEKTKGTFLFQKGVKNQKEFIVNQRNIKLSKSLTYPGVYFDGHLKFTKKIKVVR